MLLNVLDKDKEKIIQIDSSKLDTKKHFHRNTGRGFTAEDLKVFKVKESE